MKEKIRLVNPCDRCGSPSCACSWVRQKTDPVTKGIRVITKKTKFGFNHVDMDGRVVKKDGSWCYSGSKEDGGKSRENFVGEVGYMIGRSIYYNAFAPAYTWKKL